MLQGSGYSERCSSISIARVRLVALRKDIIDVIVVMD